MDERIILFAEEVCRRLGISSPRITVGRDWRTPTMLAQCSSDGFEVQVRNDSVTLDTLFALTHELRHVWQIRTDKEFYFGNYQPSNQTDSEEYNFQIAEIDANAFAANIMREAFGVEPQFNGLTKAAKKKIWERMKEL